MSSQRLLLTLDGLTAGDYLAYVRDPEPPGLGGPLRSITVHADPLGDTIEVLLVWEGAPPPRPRCEVLAGLPVTAAVVRAECQTLAIAA